MYQKVAHKPQPYTWRYGKRTSPGWVRPVIEVVQHPPFKAVSKWKAVTRWVFLPVTLTVHGGSFAGMMQSNFFTLTHVCLRHNHLVFFPKIYRRWLSHTKGDDTVAQKEMMVAQFRKLGTSRLHIFCQVVVWSRGYQEPTHVPKQKKKKDTEKINNNFQYNDDPCAQQTQGASFESSCTVLWGQVMTTTTNNNKTNYDMPGSVHRPLN